MVEITDENHEIKRSPKTKYYVIVLMQRIIV